MPADRAKPDADAAPRHEDLIVLTSGIVAAYAGNNAVSSADLPDLIGTVYGALATLGTAVPEPEVERTPAVPVKKSVTAQALICLECGNRQKTLKRHLATSHDLTPDQYRARWGLPSTYPMSAPDYSEKRRAMAKRIGLGRKPAKAPAKRQARRAKKG